MGYNCCFFLNFVPLHLESPYNYGGTGPICKLQKGCTRLAAASDKVYQLLAHGRFLSRYSGFFPTNNGRHDVAEILLKVALNTINQLN